MKVIIKSMIVLSLFVVSLCGEMIKLKMVSNDIKRFAAFNLVSDDKRFGGLAFVFKDEDYLTFQLFGTNSYSKKNVPTILKITCELEDGKNFNFETSMNTFKKSILDDSQSNLTIFTRKRDTGISRREKCKLNTLQFYIKERNEKSFQHFNSKLSTKNYFPSYYLQTPDGKNIGNIFLKREKTHYSSIFVDYYSLNDTSKSFKLLSKIKYVDNGKSEIFETNFYLYPRRDTQKVGLKDTIPFFEKTNLSKNKNIFHKYNKNITEIGEIEFYLKKK